ncbi:MAG: cytochrome c [Rhodospirillales bacterium]|nr:cytochrome c [Rhodospirillales bacterium]MBO6785556.1 cytochrome c [Rhodospirillales bacterium]
MMHSVMSRASNWRLLNNAAAVLLSVAVLIPAMASAGETLSDSRRTDLNHLLRQDCGSCHGMTLKGGLGPSLLPEQLAAWDVESLAAMILSGNPEKAMPGWSGLLSDAEARYLAQRLLEGDVQ